MSENQDKNLINKSVNTSSQINPNIVQKVKDKSKKHKQKIVLCYSFLTFVLLFCLIQVGVSVILNTSKTIAYHGKIKTMTKVRNEAEQLNKDLKNDIKLFSKSSSLEEIARNNLKMAGDDEILVIINNPPPAQDTKIKKIKKIKNIIPRKQNGRKR